MDDIKSKDISLPFQDRISSLENSWRENFIKLITVESGLNSFKTTVEAKNLAVESKFTSVEEEMSMLNKIISEVHSVVQKHSKKKDNLGQKGGFGEKQLSGVKAEVYEKMNALETTVSEVYNLLEDLRKKNMNPVLFLS